MSADTIGKELFSGVVGSVKAAAELHSALREKYPAENIFVDTSAGPGGTCEVELFGDGYDYAVAIACDGDKLIFGMFVNKEIDDRPDCVFFSHDEVLAEIARLRSAQ